MLPLQEMARRTVRKGRSPRWWLDDALPYLHRETDRAAMRWLADRRRPTRRLVDRTWDTLVVLDACRYDSFERVAAPALPGTLHGERSTGSCTYEWLRHEFGDRTCHDTVYVTANPMYRHDRVGVDLSGTFHATVDCWHPDDGAWDEEAGTVLPGDVTAAALDAHERFPDKRVVVHFMQPHLPFVGEFAEETGIGRQGYGHLADDVLAEADSGFAETVWDHLRDGTYPRSRVRRAYEGSLAAAVPHVRRLVDAVGGRCVVTADHGNLFGERSPPLFRREYGHPSEYHARSLVTVPWLVRDGPPRDVTDDPPARSAERSTVDGAVESRLRSLGYAE